MTQIVKPDKGYKYSIMHLNIRSLPGKHEQLRALVADVRDAGHHIDFILICETFLTDLNCSMYYLPEYQFICNNRKRGRGGGVAMYITDEYQYKIREDLTINHDIEFETIFAEIRNGKDTLVIGEIYRVPNTSEQLSIQRYETILQKLSDLL